MPNFEVEPRWAAQQRRHWDQQLEPARRETRATSSAQGKFFFSKFLFYSNRSNYYYSIRYFSVASTRQGLKNYRNPEHYIRKVRELPQGKRAQEPL